jgi:hypothetical protein
MEVEMKEFRLTAVLSALSFAFALPTLAADGTSQETKGAVGTGQSAQAQALAEQPRLPAEKEAASSATQNPSEMSPGSSKTTSKKNIVKGEVAKSQADQKKAMKHPPTAAMDRATPDEKATTSGTGTSGKNTPTSAMDRATPDQKSP